MDDLQDLDGQTADTAIVISDTEEETEYAILRIGMSEDDVLIICWCVSKIFSPRWIT